LQGFLVAPLRQALPKNALIGKLKKIDSQLAPHKSTAPGQIGDYFFFKPVLYLTRNSHIRVLFKM
jgi:hypothetical protein